MARGSIAKSVIIKKILENFEGAFLYNDGKEIRIPIEEDGEIIQVKVVLTAAKINVNEGDDNALPNQTIIVEQAPSEEKMKTFVEPTEQEKANVRDLLKSFGL